MSFVLVPMDILIHLLPLMTPCVSLFIKAHSSPHEQMLAIQIRHRLCSPYPSVTPCTSLNGCLLQAALQTSVESCIAVVGVFDFKLSSRCDFGLITDHFYQLQRAIAAGLPLFFFCQHVPLVQINMCDKLKAVHLDVAWHFAAA